MDANDFLAIFFFAVAVAIIVIAEILWPPDEDD